ncbi:MAG: TlpA disulfide reductase family protein [Phycisphaerales bacterium]
MKRLVALVVALAAQSALAQVSSLQPTSPHPGESLTVRYDPKAPGAALSADAPIFVTVTVDTPVGHATSWGKLEGAADGALVWTLTVPPDATGGVARFFSLDRTHLYDASAAQNFFVERSGDHGIARGMSLEEIERRYQSWRAEHPNDWTVVPARWAALEGVEPADKVAERVRNEIGELDAASTPNDAALRYAGVDARLRLARETEAIALVRDLVERMPADPWTGRCVQRLVPLAQASEPSPARDAARQVILRYAALAPTSPLLRDDLLTALAHEKDAPLEFLDRCADGWAQGQPGDARPYYLQALARVERDVEAERADSLLSRALEASFGAAHRAYADPDGTATATFVRDVLLLRSKLAAKRNDGAAALLFAVAAKGAASGLDDNTAPEIAFAMRDGWRLLGASSSTAAPVVAAAPTISTPSGGTPSQDSPPSEGAAPAFTAKDIDGNEVSLESLRGKVVVMNFWFVACGPCRMEMPALNQLAQRYSDKDVVFLAPSFDATDKCKDFLAKSEFRYRVLPDASSVVSSYHVKVFPTHVVIDRAGNVSMLRVGANSSVMGELTAAIESALAGQ